MDKIGLTIEEVTEYTGIGRDTIRKMIEWEMQNAFAYHAVRHRAFKQES